MKVSPTEQFSFITDVLVEDLIELLLDKKAETIPNLEDFIRHYFLTALGGKLGPNPVPESSATSDLKWTQVVADMLKNGQDPNILSPEGEHPLILAVNAGKIGCVKAILCFTRDIDFKDKDDWTALHHAARIRWSEIDNWTTWHHDARIRSSDIVGLLLDNQADPTCLTKLNCSPFFIAIQQKNFLLAKHLLKQNDINATDIYGWTALHWASYYDQSDFIHWLLKNGARTDIRTVNGELPVDIKRKLRN
jgi:ankyrin repeat protein